MHHSSRLRCLITPCVHSKFYSTEAEQISIPRRIHREPTDILRAIARTYQRDPSAPHYKFHDDPYLIPYSNVSKRSYALSKEAGRKAAYWIKQEHSDLFNHAHAVPMIESVLPKMVYHENETYTLDDFQKAIKNFWISDAITAYNSLLKQKIDIDPGTKQAFLELLCFYNEEDGIMEEWIEERWFKNSSREKVSLKKTWKDGGLAEKILNSMKDPPAEAYCAIICGMAKFGQTDGALHYFEEAKRKGFPIPLTVYNCLLSKGKFVKENHELIWKWEEELMHSIKNEGLKPNLTTFNSVLQTLSEMASFARCQDLSLAILSEMKSCKIEPSLATFYHLLNIHYFDRNQKSSFLYSVIDYLEKNNNLKVQDIKDTLFFVKAMEICRHRRHDMQLCYRIDALLHSHDNYNLIGDAFSESIYYRYFFLAACEMEGWEELLKLYNNLVPHVYVPEPMVMMDILKCIELNMAYDNLPRFWTDIVQFNMHEQESIVTKFLELLRISAEEKFHPQLSEIAWDIFERINNQRKQRNPIPWSGDMLSDLLVVFLKGNNVGQANLIVDKIIRLQQTLVGEIKVSALQQYVAMCITENLPDMAIKCIKYCRDWAFLETEGMAESLKTSLTLSNNQLQKLEMALSKNMD